MRMVVSGIIVWLCLTLLLGVKEGESQQVNCNVPGDVIFLMDASSSIHASDWEREKNFVEILIDSLTIQPSAIHVGMVVYSSDIGDVVGLKPYKTKRMLKEISKNLTQLRDGTNTALGIAEVRKMFRLQGRSNTPHVAIVVTDGLSSDPVVTGRQALLAKREGIKMIAVGIGNKVFTDELQQIASSASRLFNVQDFRALQGLVQSLRDIICWDITTTTSTTTTTTTHRPITTFPPWTPILPDVFGCSSPADVVFVLDGSDSIQPMDWIREKQFVAQLITSLDIGPSAINVGIVVYSSIVGDVIQLRPFKTKRNMIDLVMNLKQPRFGTNTELGIAMARQMVVYQGRKDTPQIVIVITDGRSKIPSATIIQAMGAKAEGLNMIAVGVGIDIFMDELRAIASEGKLYFAADFRALVGLVNTLKDLICKVITTTPAPMITSTHSPISDGLCDGCIIDKGVGYNPYPGDCSKYVQCYLEGNIYRSVIKPCPFGLFWDHKAITCREAANVLCPYDECKNRVDNTVHVYSDQGCRAYWVCRNRRSVSQCCAPGSRYMKMVGCIKDPSCLEACPPKHHSQNNNSCKASVHYSFDSGVTDISDNGVTAGVDNVRISNRGTAMFNGKSKINIWRFAGVEFGPDLVIKFRYRMWSPRTDWTSGSSGTWTWDSSTNSWTNSTSSAGSWMSERDGMWIGTNDQTGQQWLGMGGLDGTWIGTVNSGTGGAGGSSWTGNGGYVNTLWPNYRMSGGNAIGIGSNGIGLGNMWSDVTGTGIYGTSSASTSGSGSWVGSNPSSTGAWTGRFDSGNGGTWTGVSRTGSGTWSGTTTTGEQVTGTWTDLSGMGTYGTWSVTSGPWVGTKGTWLTSNTGGGVWTVTQVLGMSTANMGTSSTGSSSWGNYGNFGSGWNANTQTGDGTWTGTLDLGTGGGVNGMWTGTLGGTPNTGTSWSSGSNTVNRGASNWNNVQGTDTTQMSGTNTKTGGSWTRGTGKTNVNSRINPHTDKTGTRTTNTRTVNTGTLNTRKTNNVANIPKALDSMYRLDSFKFMGGKWINGEWVSDNTAPTGPQSSGWNFQREISGGLPYSGPGQPTDAGRPENIRGGWQIVGRGRNTVPETNNVFSTIPGANLNIGAQWIVQPQPNTGGTQRTEVRGGRWVQTETGPSRTTDSQGRSFITGSGMWKILGPDGRTIRSGVGNSIPANVINELMGTTGRVGWTKQLEWTIIGPNGQLIQSGTGQIPQNLIGSATVLAGGFFDMNIGNVNQWVIISSNGQITNHGIGNSPTTLVPSGSILMKIIWSRGSPQWTVSRPDGTIIKSGTGSFPQTLDLSKLLSQARLSGTGRFGIGQTGSSGSSSGGGRWIMGGSTGSGGSPQIVKVGTGPLPVAVGTNRWSVSGTQSGNRNIDFSKLIGAIGGQVPGARGVGSARSQQSITGSVSSSSQSGSGVISPGGIGSSNIAGVSSVGTDGRVNTRPLGPGGIPIGGRGSFDVKVDKTAIGPLSYDMIPIKMRHKRSLVRPQAIITNCNGINGEGPSILVAGGPSHITFSIKTVNTPSPVHITLPARPGYNDVMMKYDGSVLKAVVNDQTKTIPLSGKIEMRQAGILLGACDGFENFRGEIDEFEMFECRPTHFV